MATARDAYIKELFALSRVSVEQWSRFLEAHRLYALEHVEKMIGAPNSEIAIAVGRARETLVRLDEMQRIEELYRAIEDKEKKSKQ